MSSDPTRTAGRSAPAAMLAILLLVATVAAALATLGLPSTGDADARPDQSSGPAAPDAPATPATAATAAERDDQDAVGPAEPVDCRIARCVALSFDGGPGQYTSDLLDILREQDVRATFFLLGRDHIDRHPDLVRRIHREGHEVANHTWTHRRLTDLEPAEIHAELSRTQREIQRLTGELPTLLRPPQGYTDPRVARVAESLGLAQVLWTITAKDFATRDSELIADRVLSAVQRDDVILLHDIYSGTVPAVPTIIDRLERRGYTVVAVSDLFAPATLQPGRVYRDAWPVR